MKARAAKLHRLKMEKPLQPIIPAELEEHSGLGLQSTRKGGAFGRPGIEPRWTHGDKDGVGTAYSARAEFGSPCGTASSLKSIIQQWITRRSGTCSISSRMERLFSMKKNATWNPSASVFQVSLLASATPTPIRRAGTPSSRKSSRIRILPVFSNTVNSSVRPLLVH